MQRSRSPEAILRHSGFGVRSATARSATAEGRKPFAAPSLRRIFESNDGADLIHLACQEFQ